MSYDSTYRKDIDGLRGLAVIAVLLYHGYWVIEAGHLGVDVFFVISGHLIIGQLNVQITNGSFSFLAFWDRRIRRLVPTTFLTILATYIIGYFVLYPSDLKQMYESGAYAALFTSNFYFWSSQDYFSSDSLLVPLLHTWSLGVEEQFYIFAPVFTYFILKYVPYKQISIYLILIFLSLAIYLIANYFEKSYGFYILGFRAWEILVGGWIFLYQKKYDQLSERNYSQPLSFLLVIILLFVLFSPFKFDFYNWLPSIQGLMNLIVVLLTSLIIFNQFNNIILNNFFINHIGKSSFSIYMVHYPILALYYYKNANISQPAPILLVIGILVVGFCLYYYFERPIRFKKISMKIFYLVITFMLLIILLFSYLGSVSEGFRKDNQYKFLDYNPDNRQLIEETKLFMENYENTVINDGAKTLIIGNSFARDMYHILIAAYPQLAEDLEFKSETSLSEFIPQLGSFSKYKRLIVSQRYFDGDLDSLKKILNFNFSHQMKIAIIYNPFEFKEFGSLTFADVLIKNSHCNYEIVSCRQELINSVNAAYWAQIMSTHTDGRPVADHTNLMLQALSESHSHVSLFKRESFFCFDGKCKVLTSRLGKFFFDYGHVTKYGLKGFGILVSKNNWMRIFLDLD